MNFQPGIESYLTVTVDILSIIGVFFIVRKDYKGYGLLFLLAAVTGNILCYAFVKLSFYSFPYLIFPGISNMPIETISVFFPFLVIFSVRYSPREWVHKIGFYWVIVHLGMTAETLANQFTDTIRYNWAWDFWDSYTWWWIYLLLYEFIGGLIVRDEARKPLAAADLRQGSWGYYLLHFILITTIFAGGLYLGLAAERADVL